MGYPLPKDTALKGPFTPMRFEATVEECIVSQGEIPKDLAGGFYRCGPTWKRPTKQGTNPLLSMDGMVQGLIDDVPTVDELVQRIVREATELVRGRLGSLISPTA